MFTASFRSPFRHRLLHSSIVSIIPHSVIPRIPSNSITAQKHSSFSRISLSKLFSSVKPAHCTEALSLVLKAPHGDLLSCTEMVKVADLLAFVTSARSSCEETDSYYIDSFGNQCLFVFRALGLSSTTVFIRDLPTELKQRNELKKICTSSLASEFLEDCKFYPADTKDELHKFLWLFKEQRLKTPHWRTQHSYLTAHKVNAVYDVKSDKCTLVLTGYLWLPLCS